MDKKKEKKILCVKSLYNSRVEKRLENQNKFGN